MSKEQFATNQMLISLRQLLKHKLYDCQLQIVGTITEVLFERQTGRCSYLVFVAAESGLKMDRLEYYLAPWDTIIFSPDGKAILNLSDTQLKCLAKLTAEEWQMGMALNDTDFKCEIHKIHDYPSLTEFPNVNNNEQLLAIIKTQAKQTAKEILIDINTQGVNENPSEQSAYPGSQVYTTDLSKKMPK